MFRTALRPKWLPRHLLLVVLVAAFVLLGRWQWDVSQSRNGDLQNLLYAFQWWVLGGIVIYGWWRLLRDETYPQERTNARRTATTLPTAKPPTPVPRVVEVDDVDERHWQPRVRPTSDLIEEQLAEESDDDLAAYNEYLARLNARSQRSR